MPAVEVHSFGNGLQLLVLPEHSSPVASVQFWVRSGSVHEGKHLGSGISHLIEHLVFKGTARYGAGEAARAVQEAGGQLNAYTSYERTVYLADVPAEGLATAVDVLADLVFRPLFPEGEFEREKEVIRREIAMGRDDPRRVLVEELFACAYQTHPCRHPVIGLLGAFNALTLEDVRAFHAARYAPNNVFIVIAGDVDPQVAREWVGRATADLAAGAVPACPLPAEPAQVAPRRRLVSFATDVARIEMAWHIPAQTHPDTPALDLLGRILGQGQSSRLFRKVREEQGLAHDIGAGAYSPGFEGLFFVDGECDPAQREAFEAAALAEVAGLVRDGIGPAELDNARQCVLSDFFQGMETTQGLAAQLGASWLLTGATDFPVRYVTGLRAVTVERVRAAAATYLVPDGLTCLHMVPAGEPAASRPARPGDARPPLREVVLANGLRLLLGPDRRLPMVSVQAAFRGGAAVDPAGKAGLSAWMAAGWWKGTARSSAAELAARIEERGGRFGGGSGSNATAAGIHVLAADLRLACATLAEVMAGPAFPADAMERERASLLAAARESERHPLRRAFLEARRRLFRGTPYAEPLGGTVASLAALQPDDPAAGHRAAVCGHNGVLGVFGDFDPDAAAGWFAESFAVLPAGQDVFAGAGWRMPDDAPAPVDIALDKEQAVLVVAYPTLGLYDPDDTALDLLDEACGDMASRFFLRIRERQGLAYYVAPFQTKGWRAGAFGFYLGTSADKLDHAEAEVRDEIALLARDGLDSAELERARQTWRGKFLLHGQSAEARGHRTVVDSLLGFGADHAERQLQEVAVFPAAGLQAACERLFSRAPVIVRVRPAG